MWTYSDFNRFSKFIVKCQFSVPNLHWIVTKCFKGLEIYYWFTIDLVTSATDIPFIVFLVFAQSFGPSWSDVAMICSL